MLIIQVTYETLVQSGFIFESWSGLINYGRYTYGYNYPNVMATNPDSLTIIGINNSLPNTLNITAGLLLLATAIPITVLLY